jgi:hypothetical protein
MIHTYSDCILSWISIPLYVTIITSLRKGINDKNK